MRKVAGLGRNALGFLWFGVGLERFEGETEWKVRLVKQVFYIGLFAIFDPRMDLEQRSRNQKD